jgi:metal-dependent HD superfamily phosphatase/phosphodiesterase
MTTVEKTAPTFNLPVRQNAKLQKLVERVNADVELLQLWKCANINAVDRLGMSDHGLTHIRIVANAALKILRLLMDGGVEASVVKYHGLTRDDAEVIVVAAACTHDLGIAVHRDDHERYSLFLGYHKARQLLQPIYEEPALTTMVAEILHAIIAHDADQRCLTVEAGALKVADATDMTHGRSRIPFQAGQVNIHSVSALAIESVSIEKGEACPVRIAVTLSNSAGIFQLDELLKHKLHNSSIEPHVEVIARIESETERRLFQEYKL